MIIILKNRLLRFGAFKLSVIGILNTFTLLANIASGLLLARTLTKDTYGELIAFFASFGILRLITNFGLGVSVSRDVAQANDDPQKTQVSVYTTGMVRLISMSVVLFLGIVGGMLSGRLELLFGTLAAILASGADFTFSILAGTRHTKPIGIMTIIQPIGYLVMVMVALLVGARQADIFMGIFSLSFGLMLAAGMLLVMKEKVIKRIQRKYFRLAYLKLVLGFILASYITSLLSQLWSSLTSGSLGWIGLYQEGAEFGVAFSIVSIPIAVIGPTVMTMFFPDASYRYKEFGQKVLLAYLRNTVFWVFGITFFFSLFLLIFADQITSFFYGEKYLVSADYLRILSGVPITSGIFPILTLSLFAMDKAWKSLLGLGLQTIILIAAILLNINNLNGMVLSWSVLLASFTGVTAQLFIVQKILKQ